MTDLSQEEVHTWIGVLFFDLEAYEEVLSFTRGQLDEDSAFLYARSLYAVGKTEEARAYVSEVGGSNRRFTLGARVAFLLADGKRDEAVALVRPERKTFEGSLALHILCDFLEARGEHAPVVELVDEATTTDEWTLQQLANALVGLERKEDARALGRRLVAGRSLYARAAGATILERTGE